jgi:predicted DNA-binding protein
MLRTQVYLTKEERGSLNIIAKQTGHTQSQLVREAIDRFVSQFQYDNRAAILRKAKGLWAKRTDLPNFEKLRKELDRQKDGSH